MLARIVQRLDSTNFSLDIHVTFYLQTLSYILFVLNLLCFDHKLAPSMYYIFSSSLTCDRFSSCSTARFANQLPKLAVLIALATVCRRRTALDQFVLCRHQCLCVLIWFIELQRYFQCDISIDLSAYMYIFSSRVLDCHVGVLM